MTTEPEHWNKAYAPTYAAHQFYESHKVSNEEAFGDVDDSYVKFRKVQDLPVAMTPTQLIKDLYERRRLKQCAIQRRQDTLQNTFVRHDFKTELVKTELLKTEWTNHKNDRGDRDVCTECGNVMLDGGQVQRREKNVYLQDIIIEPEKEREELEKKPHHGFENIKKESLPRY